MVLVAAVIVLLLMVGIYVWGNMQTRNQLKAQATDYQQRISLVDTQLQETRRELAAARNRNHLLMARSSLDALRASIKGMNINVATNLQEQRAQVLGLASQLDAMAFADTGAAVAQ